MKVFIKMLRICFTFCLLGFYTFTIPEVVAQKKPNVIIFIGDDISYNDFGCYGHPEIKTPNIDKLAGGGLIFTNAFLTSSSCSPSRASIITGRYPHNNGAAELHTPLEKNQIVFPKLLRNAGYFTGQAGKWHFGTQKPVPGDAMEGAFDRIGGSRSDGGGESGAEKWVEYVKDRPQDKPFMFWFAAHDAHRPWDQEFLPVKYKPEEVIVPPYLLDSPSTREDLANYYAEVSRFDYYIGKVVEELEKQGILDNTIILVMADNGRPFPNNKTRLYDEGIKTPLVIHWPDGIKAEGLRSESLLSVIDIAPTILDIAELEKPSPFQGRSFKKLFHNPHEEFRSYVFAEHNWHDFKAHERMVRTKNFLFIENNLPLLDNRGAADVMNGAAGVDLREAFQKGKLSDLQKRIFSTPQPKKEFYHIVNDSLQLNNLYGEKAFASKQKQMEKILQKWKKKTGDSKPEFLTPDWYVRKTIEPLEIRGERGVIPGADKGATKINKSGPF